MHQPWFFCSSPIYIVRQTEVIICKRKAIFCCFVFGRMGWRRWLGGGLAHSSSRSKVHQAGEMIGKSVEKTVGFGLDNP